MPVNEEPICRSDKELASAELARELLRYRRKMKRIEEHGEKSAQVTGASSPLEGPDGDGDNGNRSSHRRKSSRPRSVSDPSSILFG